jgi:allophanate hydrolase
VAQVDLLLVPTAPGHPSFAEVDADPVGANARLGTYTNFVNLLGWCALACRPAHRPGPALRRDLHRPGGFDAAAAGRLGQRWQAHGDRRRAPPAEPPPNPPLRPRLARTASHAASLGVVGAHLSGLPLNGQLRRARRHAALRHDHRTALPAIRAARHHAAQARPAARARRAAHAIALEVWAMPLSAVGSFLALIPPPLGLGSVELADGRHVHGFICEGACRWPARSTSAPRSAAGAYRASLAPT